MTLIFEIYVPATRANGRNGFALVFAIWRMNFGALDDICVSCVKRASIIPAWLTGGDLFPRRADWALEVGASGESRMAALLG